MPRHGSPQLDRLVLYGGGIALLLALAVLREQLPNADRPRNAVPADAPGHSAPQPATADLPPVQRDPEGAFHRGMVVGLFPWRDEEPRFLDAFREMHALGVNHVSFNFNWYMDTIRDPIVYRGVADAWNRTVSDAVLAQAIRDAHTAGLRVMLFPTVYVLRLDEGEWRGRIAPPDWERWFASYRALVTDLAILAEANGAEALCVGVELISSEIHTARWQQIVADVRASYGGRLAYSLNWDARHVRPWFSQLDLIAINAYWELTDRADADIDELVAAWDGIREEIEPWRRAIGLPLIVSELGYRSSDGSLTKPWNYFLPGGVDLDEQRRGYEAFFRAWIDDPMLGGLYIYHWFGEGGPSDRSYTPRGKPAASTLREWFARIAERDAERVADALATNEADD